MQPVPALRLAEPPPPPRRGSAQRGWPLLALLSAWILTALSWAAPASAQPNPGKPPAGVAASPASPAKSELRERARLHFRKGIKLFRLRNYTAALAEFEASYAAKASGSTLKNIALCQEKLFRYGASASSLRQLLETHKAELSPEDVSAIPNAIAELDDLVGVVELSTSPPDARVSLDGRLLEKGEKRLRLDVGEHVFTADAPGYANLRRVVRVAGGARPIDVKLELRATRGFISVQSEDRSAAIAIDGTPVAFHRWKGPVEPGRHYVQVYRSGFKPFESVVHVAVGKTAVIQAKLGRALDPSEEDDQIDLGATGPEEKKEGANRQRGWYFIGALSALSLDRSPSVVDQDGADVAGGSIGGRAGYRFWTPVAIELLAELGNTTVNDACAPATEGSANQATGSNCPDERIRRYELTSGRVGAGLRIFSSGEQLRFSGAAGFGLVYQSLSLDEKDDFSGGTARGLDPYFSIELGAQYNTGHVLLGLDVLTYFNGTSNLNGSLDGSDSAVYEGNGLITAGLGLRIGWSSWSYED